MVESVLFFVVVVALSYGIYIRGRARRVAETIHIGDPIDYTLTIWAERAIAAESMENNSLPLQPQRISVEYAVSVIFAEEREMREARIACAESASADFHRRFTPILGEINIGAVRFDPVHKDG